MPVGAGRTAAWAKMGDICLYISGKGPPSEADWSEYLVWLKEAAKPTSLKPEVRTLVYDRSTGPNAAQRKQLNDATMGWKLRVAVVTPSTIVRHMVTAMNWFKKDSYEAFALEDLDRALTFMGTPPGLMNEVKQSIRGLAAELDK